MLPCPSSCRRVPRPGPGDPSGGVRPRPGRSKRLLRVSPGCRGAQGRLAYKLLHDLFANYSSALRPVEDTDRALNVTLQVTLSQIIDMVSPGSAPAPLRCPQRIPPGPALPLSRA